MKLSELAVAYRENSERCRRCAELLRHTIRDEELSETQRHQYRRKLHMVEEMAREARGISHRLENYYSRSTWNTTQD